MTPSDGDGGSARLASPSPRTEESTVPPQAKAPATPAPFVQPLAPAVVLWRPSPGADPAFAVITRHGKHANSLLVFPTESRGGIPKDGVRHVDDPWNYTAGIQADSGVWDFTDESKILRTLATRLIGDESGMVAPIPPEAVALLKSLLK